MPIYYLSTETDAVLESEGGVLLCTEATTALTKGSSPDITDQLVDVN